MATHLRAKRKRRTLALVDEWLHSALDNWELTDYTRLILNFDNVVRGFLDYPSSCFEDAGVKSIVCWHIGVVLYLYLVRKNVVVISVWVIL